MIDLKQLREDPQRFREGAAKKGVRVDIDALLDLDKRLRGAQTELQQLASEKNRLSAEIGRIAMRLKKAEHGLPARAKEDPSASPRDEGRDPAHGLEGHAPVHDLEGHAPTRAALEAQMRELQQRPAAIKQREGELAAVVADLEKQRDARWLEVPQPPDPDVPVGTSADDNIEVRRWNPEWFDTGRSFHDNRGFHPRTHIDLGTGLGMIDFERGVKMAGSRSYILTGDGMLLQQALLRWAFDYMVREHGFSPLTVPVLVRDEIMVGTGFFPAGREQAYEIKETERGGGHDVYLTGTGEVGLMGYHMGEILDLDSLPRRYVTLSPCYRREAGAAGKETAGLYRVHVFDKVEQVVICRADEVESRAWHTKMIGFVETLMQRLELPYRILQCCTGDLGPKNADMIDIEAWMPGRGEEDESGRPHGAYGETHSASRLYDYQCRRLNIRYRDPETKKTVFCHSLNNTVAATPRLLIPIMEMYQNEDGSITVPRVLREYLGGMERIG